MLNKNKKYKVRYYISLWNKTVPKPEADECVQVIPGISVAPGDFGYADDILVVSIMREHQTGDIASIALFDSISLCGMPSRELLEAVRDQINHHLEHHCE